ncbi:hypothetical protein DSL72_006336 [Monilinia vaccinii-corymbosi]|uniref:CSC1/OSCA1-like 7TM region domain-containing protein n=1 Tax=Monilinia vaccinii-corymbosi TaxID=61207 RepID=A0A8A3PLY5_9HELO|nr:hypothetical protein DSL72_006336 [Monilinia vaccinii-corymbosi]
MSSVLSSDPSATSAAATSASTSSMGLGAAQGSQGISLVALLTAMASSSIIFGVQMVAFMLLRNKLARIFKPKTYLVPERERTEPPPRSPWGWLFAIFQFQDREVINKCGLDAYFFLRYLQTLLVIFIPMAVVIIPILVPINYIGGRGPAWALQFAGDKNLTEVSSNPNVTGLDQLAWTNVQPTKTHRYWAHLVLALLAITWVCGVFFVELRVYIKVRQDYLTSAEHRLRASATTVLVSAIPNKWLTKEALAGLYDVFPGGIRNIWINRNYDELLTKIHLRDEIHLMLEGAETQLIRAAKRAQKKLKEKEEKAQARASRRRAPTKEEKAERIQRENELAERLAKSGGVATGEEAPHTVDDAVGEEEELERQEAARQHKRHSSKSKFKLVHPLTTMGQGFDAVGQGLNKGVGAVGKAGETALGGVRGLGRELDETIEETNGNGFVALDARSIGGDDEYDHYGRYRYRTTPPAPYGSGVAEKKQDPEKLAAPGGEDRPSISSESDPRSFEGDRKLAGNTVRRNGFQYGGDGANDSSRNDNWWKFWEGPAGGFPSPIPTGYEDDQFPLTQGDGPRSRVATGAPKKSTWEVIKSIIPFLQTDNGPGVEYPKAFNDEYKEDATEAAWQRYLKERDRPTHRIARFSWTPTWFFAIPGISPKVDTIYWCRGQLAQLNLEIELDQKSPERFPLMNSAFIQFNHQVAAHMACQSVTYHVPKQMAPRTVEISPNDVLWDNMSIKWWEAWLRTAVVTAVVLGMILLWSIPVAWTSTLSQISSLVSTKPWLHWLKVIPEKTLQAIAGVLPALVLSILLSLVPTILGYLAFVQGSQTGNEKQGSVQTYYFAFLFVQVFLVVSISGGAVAALGSWSSDITSIPETLAQQLPKAANYFFSYMILQALSVSSGTLLQLTTLIFWFVLPKVFDNTARQKWTRNTTLPSVSWGSFFPVYTNFACIGLIYCVVSPVIIIFAIITFTLLWIANRYNMLYVSRFRIDTGGLLYPRAINQTFTGLYVMELCLIGLFFLTQDEQGNVLAAQALIMIVALLLTALYQFLLNWSFGPLLRYLPITFEDEAVLRDEAFDRMQAKRLGLTTDDPEDLPQNDGTGIHGPGYIEMENLQQTGGGKFSKLRPTNLVHGAAVAGSWAVRSGRNLRHKTFTRGSGTDGAHGTEERIVQPRITRKRQHRDIEAQKRIANALYGGYNDEIEDLAPEERDGLVKHAFQHYALRARRPVVWIPRDDIGVSDDEVRRTRDYAGENIWISNVGAALDAKPRELPVSESATTRRTLCADAAVADPSTSKSTPVRDVVTQQPRPVNKSNDDPAQINANLSQIDNWGEKAKRRKTTGTGRMRHMKEVPRRFKNGFQTGAPKGARGPANKSSE